jgi:nickel-dependent lactate racemase
MDREDLTKKLGEDIVSRFLVYNHNSHDYCTYVGTTSNGTKVYVNTEFMSCDFKISIGSLTPHLFVIFGGGSKMILPGVSHIDTIEYNHKLGTDPALKAKYETHPVHLDMDEAASFVGLDVNIEGFVNLWGDTTTLFAGEPKQAHTAGIEAAKSHYLTPRAQDKDIVIANAYMKASESATAAAMCLPMVKPGGDLVLVNNTPSGQVVHYMGGPWGKAIQPRKPVLMPIPPNVNRLIIYNEYPELVGLSYYDRQDKVMMLSNWDDILQALKEVHGDKPAVAVYPTADISYFG